MKQHHTKIETFINKMKLTIFMEEKTAFREALGDSPVIKVLEFMIEGRDLDYSLTDIAHNSNIGWSTLHRIWDNLVKLNIVKHTRMIGKAKLFRLNQDTNTVKDLMRLYDTILIEHTEENLSKKAIARKR